MSIPVRHTLVGSSLRFVAIRFTYVWVYGFPDCLQLSLSSRYNKWETQLNGMKQNKQRWPENHQIIKLAQKWKERIIHSHYKLKIGFSIVYSGTWA